MRDLSLAINDVNKRKTKVHSSSAGLNLAIVTSIAILGLVYLFTINTMGTKGYAIKKFETELQALQDQQKDLMLQTSDLQSINRIQTQAQALNFVPTSNITYLKASDFAFK